MVPDRKDPTMNAVQAPGAEAGGTTLAVNASVLKLLERDHPVLPGGNPGDLPVRATIGDFSIHLHA